MAVRANLCFAVFVLMLLTCYDPKKLHQTEVEASGMLTLSMRLKFEIISSRVSELPWLPRRG